MANNDSTALPQPATRALRAYAFDPSHGRLLGNDMQIEIPYRKLKKGPIDPGNSRDAIAVIDYDVPNKRYYKPVDLDDSRVLISNGLWPSESDPRFHQQMVYAVASDTVAHFEKALGRRIHWRRAERKSGEPKGWCEEDILTLNLYPHAMQQANAFYSPDAHGIMFGYFRADRSEAGRNIPGQTVFTCLSHDIVAHEMTHAIVDGLRGYFLEQTNVDVAAFHEAFADLVALFRHFTHREVVLDTLQRTGGQLYREQLSTDAMPLGASSAGSASGPMIAAQISARNPLIELATQFGEASGMQRGLRSALGTPPTPAAIGKLTEPHARGSILVAAVFDAFLSVYLRRTADLFRIFRAGGGSANPVDLPGPLAQQLCAEATNTAEQFFVTCVRALDYCPPVDMTFGDFLRAVITCLMDFDEPDPEGVRDAWMQAFRRRGIVPTGAHYFSDDALCWPNGLTLQLPDAPKLSLGGISGLNSQDKGAVRRVLDDYVRDVLSLSTVDHEQLGLDPGLPFEIPSFHSLVRVNRSGSVRMDMVVEVVQTNLTRFSPPYHELGPVPFRGGATLIFSTHGTSGGRTGDAFVRYVAAKGLHGPKGDERRERQEAHLLRTGVAEGTAPNRLRVNFALVHGGF